MFVPQWQHQRQLKDEKKEIVLGISFYLYVQATKSLHLQRVLHLVRIIFI